MLGSAASVTTRALLGEASHSARTNHSHRKVGAPMVQARDCHDLAVRMWGRGARIETRILSIVAAQGSEV
jgi:hypothetical protein